MGKAFESIKRGLEEAIEHAQGKRRKGRVHEPRAVDVRAMRKRMELTQLEFAAACGISVGTLRHWERGDRQPRGPALVLLNVVAREPQAVFSALAK